jgi:2'-5' RNA ligase
VLLDDTVRAALGAAIERLRRAAHHVAWVAPANLHFTLKFLGQVDEARLPELGAALAAAAVARSGFTAAVTGLGAFPSPARPRVVWAGVDEGAPALTELAAGVEQALVALGFPPEARPFSPHVTLGRVRVPRRDARLADLLTVAAREEFGRVRVERVVLMESQLSPGGARYSERAGAPLGTPSRFLDIDATRGDS